MRQRLEQKRQEQEKIEKNQEALAQCRRSKGAKVSMRSDDGGQPKHPEKVVLLAKGAKIPWVNIGTNHGGYKAIHLHAAATKLEGEQLGMLI